MFIEAYKTCCVTAVTIMIIALLLGIDVEVKPFKYSLKNIIKFIRNR